jgi:hypothetical protein
LRVDSQSGGDAGDAHGVGRSGGGAGIQGLREGIWREGSGNPEKHAFRDLPRWAGVSRVARNFQRSHA